jgi:hypothetical protein
MNIIISDSAPRVTHFFEVTHAYIFSPKAPQTLLLETNNILSVHDHSPRRFEFNDDDAIESGRDSTKDIIN